MKTILFEGVNRVGKTSILNHLSYLIEKDSPNNFCNVITEVSFSELGKSVYKDLVKERIYDDYTSYLLYMAIRRRNYEIIEKYRKLYFNKNIYNIIDRGILSTMVYQRNAFIDLEIMYLNIENDLKERFIKPDIIFYIKRDLNQVLYLSEAKGISKKEVLDNIVKYENAISFLRSKAWNIIELENKDIKKTALTCFNYIKNN